ncbi:MAG TPA: copper-translocating P-type ATPase [Gaiellaceae bacterium]|nr:copper-translocating P-type ATPase [Gaiellaceae bacterium]
MRGAMEHNHGHDAVDAPEVQGREREHELHRAAAEHAGHAAGHGAADHAAHGDVYRRRFWITLILAIPVVAYSEMIQDWFGYTAPEFSGDGWVAPVLGTVIYFYGGSVFLTGAWSEIRRRAPGMMLLVSLAITVAFLASAASTLDLFDLEFWWELSALVVIMLLGHWQEMKALGQARGALSALAELLPDEAERVRDGETELVQLHELEPGDVVLVRPGGRVPADGEIVDGEAELDESMITGESKPVAKAVEDRVTAGTVATDSAIRVRVTAVGEETALAGIQRLVAEAQESRSRTQALADRAAALLFYVAVASAIAAFAVWAIVGDVDFGVLSAVAVLVISCPHALGLAIPLVISISTSLAARSGILVKDRLSLERSRLVDVVLFDKTGTLTRGEHVLTGVASREPDAALAQAAAVESASEHPLARAIVAAARERGSIPAAGDFRAMSGRGVEASVNGTPVAVGGPRLLRERGLDVPDELRRETDPWGSRGASVLYLVRDATVVGAFALEDQVRPEAREAVGRLHELGIRVAMITGDARQVAEAVAAELGIDEVFAEVLPEDKEHYVRQLQEAGRRVAMVGDGVNDAPALARADVGIAIGAGTDVAIESAGVILASDDPRAVVGVVRLSRASYRKMVQNLVWAAGYNIVAIPIAAGVLAPWGVTMPPAVGALLMSLSTIVVALNAQLLRRLDLRPGAERG